jgi:hypothetical protein
LDAVEVIGRLQAKRRRKNETGRGERSNAALSFFRFLSFSFKKFSFFSAFISTGKIAI